VRLRSSSGGVFTEIAKIIFSKNGVVIGAGFDQNVNLEHRIAENECELSALRGSKYVQSNKSDILSVTKKLLEQKKIVAFFGTPCEIHGLKNFLGVEYENLITVDFVCHGVPSPMVFKNTIRNFERQKNSKVINFSFREKVNGWRDQTAVVYYSNGTKECIKSSNFDYYTLFLGNYFLRHSCYTCNFPNSHIADLTLGDYWQAVNDDDKGVSLVSINSMKGKMLFSELSSRLVTGPLSKKEVNACFTNHSCDNHYDARLREKFFFNYFKCGHIKTLKKFYLIEKFKSVITKMKYYCVAIAKRIRCIFNVKK
jgi:coenzyme F420-reducing hydrogenase beta subunit